MEIDRIFQKGLRQLGLDLTRFSPEQSFGWCLQRMLGVHAVDLVVDVGAHDGRYGTKLRALGYSSKILSFEPLPEEHALLREKAARDPKWSVAPRMALGRESGEGRLHVSRRRSSSSILEPVRARSQGMQMLETEESIRVPLSTLDRELPVRSGPGDRVFVKVDVQGYEDRVLDGASDVLKRVVGWQIEMATRPLYEDQLLYRRLLDRLSRLGFELWHLAPVLVDPDSGRLLQFDAVLFRDEEKGDGGGE